MTSPDRTPGKERHALHDPASYVRAYFVSTLERATERPLAVDVEPALDAFFAFDAAFFLGQWLGPAIHRRLLHRMGDVLPGLAGIEPPASPDYRIVLAQHVRELEAELGPTPWTSRLRARTEAEVPTAEANWDDGIRQAARTFAVTADHRPLAVAHARRRLWALAHPTSPAAVASPRPIAAFRSLVREAINGDARTVQVVEIAADELLTAPNLAADLLAALLPPRR